MLLRYNVAEMFLYYRQSRLIAQLLIPTSLSPLDSIFDYSCIPAREQTIHEESLRSRTDYRATGIWCKRIRECARALLLAP